MWMLIRPDAVNALETDSVKKALPRYVKVVKNELPAKFMISKKVPIKFNKRDAEEKLWKTHSIAMEEFHKLESQIKDIEELNEIKNPRQSLLDLKITLTKEIMKNCELCEWKCHKNRLKGELGECKVGNICLISSESPHYGEESYYVPSHTIFFWSCNMQCIFCQNYTISHRLEAGIQITPKLLAECIEQRRKEGCRNCNLVGGESTMSLLWILEALSYCKSNTPILWNSNMFMSEKTMQILDGIIDVYLTDFKYGPGKCSEKLTKVKNYWDIVTRNHLIATSQTEITIRHLILPNHIECCSFPILGWIAENIKEKYLLNLMDQFYPCYLAKKYPDINRRITKEEYRKVLEKAKKLSLNIRG